jgi:hypothetical protein
MRPRLLTEAITLPLSTPETPMQHTPTTCNEGTLQAAQAEFDAGKLAFERREGTLQSLRLKWRNVTTRIARTSNGETLANTDTEYAEMIGRHLTQIATSAGWPNADQWAPRTTRAHTENGLTGIRDLITTMANQAYDH